ncbi:Uncharacterised protein [Mycobacteroides abscessus subsp. abscessus]|nr:Uncharacterised protein [Mycobacteroides abscessus subsp. abscessus]
MVQARPAQPIPRPPRGRTQRIGGTHADPGERGNLIGDAPVRDRTAGIGTGVDGDTGVVCVSEGRVQARVQGTHVLRVLRVFTGLVRDTGEVLDVDDGRDERGTVFGHQGDGVVGETGTVLDAIDAGANEARQRVLAEDMRGDTCTVGVRGGNGLFEDLVRP